MQFKNFSRRDFIKGSVSAVAFASIPGRNAFGQTTIRNRPEWNEFKVSSSYASFIDAIRVMRANTDSNDRRSWSYWSNIHVRSCPHGIPYFLAWHRGYLHYFQQVLRDISGDSALMVPYWDYYKNSTMPAEFTDPASGNPLYVTGRVNANVYSALSLTPFSIRYKNFQRGTTDAFEASIEYRPHGSFHNIVGGVMAKMSAPMDPIFWLHHGQIDRLWAAWVAADNGRQMPPITDPYWSGSYTYRTDLTMPRQQAYDTTTYLGYDYLNKTLPTSLPPQAQAARIIRVQLQTGQGSPRRPPSRNFPLSAPRPLGNNRRAVGGATSVALDEGSVSVQIPVEPSDRHVLQDIVDSAQTPTPDKKGPAQRQYSSVQIALENARLTRAGEAGGFYYDVYLNLPDNGGGAEPDFFIGSFGPFEISANQHHAGASRLTLPATRALQMMASGQMIRDMIISFVRRSGTNAPAGPVVVIGEVRVELSNDPIE